MVYTSCIKLSRRMVTFMRHVFVQDRCGTHLDKKVSLRVQLAMPCVALLGEEWHRWNAAEWPGAGSGRRCSWCTRTAASPPLFCCALSSCSVAMLFSWIKSHPDQHLGDRDYLQWMMSIIMITKMFMIIKIIMITNITNDQQDVTGCCLW